MLTMLRQLCPTTCLTKNVRMFSANNVASNVNSIGGLLTSNDASLKKESRVIRTMNKGIKVSPQKLNLLAKQVAGLYVEEALVQMKFSQKRKSTVVAKTITNAVNLADINYGIKPENLKIKEAVVGKGKFLKRIKIMGRGNTGVMHHPHAHLTIILEETSVNRRRPKYLSPVSSEVSNESPKIDE